MPRCSYHPGVEANVRCVTCDRYICPRDWVHTPVGYKCRDCARQLPSARRAVKPRQLLLAAVAAVVTGIGGAFALALLGLRFWLLAALLGAITGEAARRASGGHRGGQIAAAAGLAVLAGTYAAGLGILAMFVSTLAAVVVVLSNRL